MFKKLTRYTLTLSDLADVCATVICWPMAGALFILILLEITLRYVFLTSLEWNNDVIRLCFTWAVLIAFSIALKRHSHIEFRFLTDRLPPRIREVVALFSHLVCFCFFVYVAVEGFHHFQASEYTKFIVLDMSKKWQVLPLPLTGVFMSLHSLAVLVEKIDSLVS